MAEAQIFPYGQRPAAETPVTWMQDAQGNWVPMLSTPQNPAVNPIPMAPTVPQPSLVQPPAPVPQAGPQPMSPPAPQMPVNPAVGVPPPVPAVPAPAPVQAPGPTAPAALNMTGVPGPGVPTPQSAPPAALPIPPMAQASQGLPPEFAPGPAKTPEEVQARKQGWMNFAERLKSDPNMQMMLLRLGTALMQPVPAGQTPLGHVGTAIAGSMDYLSSLQAAQSKQAMEAAQTQEIGARTQTEQKRPAAIEAETAATKEKTKNLQAMQDVNIREAEAKIKAMEADGALKSVQAEAYREDIKRNPQYAAAVIAELEARAWAHRHPYDAVKAGNNAKMAYVNNLADALLQADPELQALAKTDPKGARARAVLEANDRMVAGNVLMRGQAETAKDIYASLEAEYEAAKASGDKEAAKLTKEQFILDKLSDPLRGYDAKVKTQVYGMIGKPSGTKGSGQTPSGAGGRPPLESFQR